MTFETKQEHPESGAKRDTAAAKCDVKNLVSPGAGFWKYVHADISPREARVEGFFAEALEKFGMREGDVVFVHAGNGKAFLVGV